MSISKEILTTICWLWSALAIIIFVVLQRITAPYGRHTDDKFGIMVDNRMGWMLMESIGPLIFSYFFFNGSTEKTTLHYLFLILYILHYLNRAIIFPLRIKTQGKKMPLMIVVSAIFFNVINGTLNGLWLGNYTNSFSKVYMAIGLTIFTIGVIINVTSDNILLSLRKPGETGYKIPQGGLFKWVSCPNLFGEIVEWIGYCIANPNPATISFAIWTFCNLSPRAQAHHKWYLNKFSDYPKVRKAVIPKVW